MTPKEFQVSGLTWTALNPRSGVQDEHNIWRRDDEADVDRIDDELFGQIEALCVQGREHMRSKRPWDAHLAFAAAVKLVPEPIGRWNCTGWALLALGHVHVVAQNWSTAREILGDAMWSPGVFGNPWAHRLKGQVHYALNERERAVDDLTRAYMGAGRPVFKDAGPECLVLVEEAVNAKDRFTVGEA